MCIRDRGQTASWLLAICLGKAAGSAFLSWRAKVPMVLAWSTPGAALIAATQGRAAGLADGIVVTPSHNPPADGGFKYNPPHGGPADTDATSVIAHRANELMRAGLMGIKRVPFTRARAACGTPVRCLPAAPLPPRYPPHHASAKRLAT